MVKFLSCLGMPEGESLCMETEPCGLLIFGSIHLVSDERMTKSRKMSADLMSYSGNNCNPH